MQSNIAKHFCIIEPFDICRIAIDKGLPILPDFSKLLTSFEYWMKK